MKLKNLFTTLGLAAVLAIGAGIGLTANQEFKAVKADRTSRVYIDASQTIWLSSWGGNYSNIGAKVWKEGIGDDVYINPVSTITIDSTEYGYFDLPSTDYDGGYIYCWNDSTPQNKTKTNFSIPSDGKNLLVLSGGTGNEGPTWSWSDTIIVVGETVNVGFDEDGNGTADKVEVIAKGETVAAYTPYKFAKVFDGWYLNDNPFDFDTPVNEDILLTAKWTDREGEVDYIYVITGYGADWSTRYIYGYGDTEGYGTWKGALLTDIAVGVTKTANFGGGNDQYINGGIYKVPFYTEDYMSNIILHNNGSEDDRSGDLPFGQGYGYFFKNNPWNDEGGCFDEEKMMSVGLAAKYVYEFDEILSGEDFCKLDPEVCAELWNNYRDIARDDEYIDGWISSSCINTANGGDNVPLSVILPELKKIAERNGQYVEESMMKNSLTADSETTIIIVVIAAFIAISTFGVCLVIKRRKQFNK